MCKATNSAGSAELRTIIYVSGGMIQEIIVMEKLSTVVMFSAN